MLRIYLLILAACLTGCSTTGTQPKPTPSLNLKLPPVQYVP